MIFQNKRKPLTAALMGAALIWGGSLGISVQAADFQAEQQVKISETDQKGKGTDTDQKVKNTDTDQKANSSETVQKVKDEDNDMMDNVIDAAEAESRRIRQEKAQAARAEAQKRAEEEAQKRKEAQERKEAEEARKAAEEAKKAEEEARKAEEAAKEKARKAEEARMAKRTELVDFALQYEGNPYVYGGTSLTNGADCSGFVMSVFQEFGYSLPRTAADQAAASQQRTFEELEPGDLVFYGGWGIGHVALYMGDGKIIHASTESTGIIVSDYDYDQPVMYGSYME